MRSLGTRMMSAKGQSWVMRCLRGPILDLQILKVTVRTMGAGGFCVGASLLLSSLRLIITCISKENKQSPNGNNHLETFCYIRPKPWLILLSSYACHGSIGIFTTLANLSCVFQIIHKVAPHTTTTSLKACTTCL